MTFIDLFMIYKYFMNIVKLTEPLHHIFDRGEVFLLLFLWIGIIIP